MQRALDALGAVVHQIVTQVVKAKLVIRTVGDVRLIRGNFILALHTGEAHAHRQAQEVVQHAHFGRVAFGQVVIHGHNVHALVGDRVQIHRQRGHQGFTFTGTHLGDFALVQHHTADQLYVKMTHAERALRRFAHHGKSLRQQAVQTRAIGITLFELFGFRAQFVIAQRLHLRL